jgi:hypothetical protein
MQQIVKTEDREEFGLSRRDIFGLNIIAANGVATATEDDPRVVFLRELSARHVCSAHTGNLYDLADTPEEIFGRLVGKDVGSPVRVSVNGGTFYDAARWATFPACFFPVVSEQFWSSRAPEGDADISDLLRLDALALYVEPINGAVNEMRSGLNQPFTSHETWLQTVSSLYQLVLLTGADGWYFSAYSRDARYFDSLSLPLNEAIKAIERNIWYQQHAASLIWDDEHEGCLLLPELMRKPAP